MIFGSDRRSNFKKLLKELQDDVVFETAKFSVDVESEYSEKVRSSELNQMMLSLGALGFFVHSISRVSFREDSEKLREAVFDDTAFKLSRLLGEMIRGLSEGTVTTAEADTLKLLNIRGVQYSGVKSFLGTSGSDRNTALWLAARSIAEDLDHPEDFYLELIIQGRLMQGLINLNLGNRIYAMESLL